MRLLNCAFLGILRAHQICVAAGLAPFSQGLLQVLRAAFDGGRSRVHPGPVRLQADARLLERRAHGHPGARRRAWGSGAFGTALHAVNHSLTKACLFLVAGNILAAYETKSVAEVQGLSRRLPFSGVLWVAGFLAISGSPPFGPFLSELTILKAALDQGRGIVAAAYLALLAVIFIGMANVVLPMAQGRADHPLRAARGRRGALGHASARGLGGDRPGARRLRPAGHERRPARSGPIPGRAMMTTATSNHFRCR